MNVYFCVFLCICVSLYFLCVCVCVCVCVYVCACFSVYVCVFLWCVNFCCGCMSFYCMCVFLVCVCVCFSGCVYKCVFMSVHLCVYVSIYVHLYTWIYQSSSPRAQCDTKWIFKPGTADSNSKSSFSQNGCLTKAKETSLHYYLSINGKENRWFHAFSRELVQRETQTTLCMFKKYRDWNYNYRNEQWMKH